MSNSNPNINNEWELSKENIQPIKQGRKAAVLTIALDENQQQKLTLQKQEFEKELRTYSGDDPIDLWYRYTLWIEQNYPKGGSEGNLTKLIESCFTSLKASGLIESKYLNDERFLSIWIKYINLCPCPLDVYQTLYKKNYCCNLADFYENWAWEIEKTGNLKKANAVYLEGLQRKATPVNSLEIAYSKFQARVMKVTVDGLEAPQTLENNNLVSSQRVILSSLKSVGPRAQAPTDRVTGIVGTTGRFTSSQGGNTTNAVQSGFTIFSDENQIPSLVLESQNATSNVLTNEALLGKENSKCPGKWAKNKINQRSTSVVPVDDVAKFSKAPFEVHEDKMPGNEHSTPARHPELSGILCQRKDDEQEWHVPLFIQEPYNPLYQPQYCKEKVYCGTEEFSFEELRAADRLKKEEEAKKDEEIASIKEEMVALKEMVKQLTSVLKEKECSASSKTEVKKLDEDSWIVANKSTNITQSNLLASGALDLLSVETSTEKPILSTLELLPSIKSKESLQNTFGTGNNCSNPGSPTVNTKFANKIVTELFNGTLFQASNFCDSMATFEAQKDSKPVQDFQIYQDTSVRQSASCAIGLSKQPQSFPVFCDDQPAFQNGPGKCQPFHIYSDEKENPGGSVVMKRRPKTAAPLAPICADEMSHSNLRHEDEENIKPKDYIEVVEKRQLAGILQPSMAIEVISQEELKKMKQLEDEQMAVEIDGNEEGIEPFCKEDQREDCTLKMLSCNDDFTLKMPSCNQAFEKMACFTSTPLPWSSVVVPRTKNKDSTMVSYAHQSQEACRKKITEKAIDITPKDTLGENLRLCADNKDEENSGELMPPPTVEFSIKSSTHDKSLTTTVSIKNNLSPILEASRENRYSSSSGSSSSSGGISNFHLTQNTAHTRSLHFSRSRAITGISQTEPFGSSVHIDEITKSGYLADKSKGESMADVAPKIRLLKSMDEEELHTSFDPLKVAAILLQMDKDLASSPIMTETVDIKEKMVIDKELCWECPIDRQTIQFPSEIDPFCPKLQEKLLAALKKPLKEGSAFVLVDSKIPKVKPGIHLKLGKEMFIVKKQRGTGAYAQVFHASTVDPMNVTLRPSNDDDEQEDEESQMTLKVQKPPALWEFYICFQLRERLKVKGSDSDMLDSFMRINRGYFFENGSILVSNYHKYGTILDLVNKYKRSGCAVSDIGVMYLMVQLIVIIMELHSCRIVHGDIKPDNILIVGVPDVSSLEGTDYLRPQEHMILKLIDFGRSIDLSILPPGTTFKRKVTTEGFSCTEMRDNRPWTYQTDFYGLASVAYSLLFLSYMNIKKENKWILSGVTFQRRWQKDLWLMFFDKMLNISSCSEIPDFADLLEKFVDIINQRHNQLVCDMKTLCSLLSDGS